MPVWMNDLCACNLITDYFSYSYQTVTKLSLFSELHGSSLLLVRPLSADEEDFICSESQAGCGRFRNTTLAGCYVEIAPIWNVIKVVWLHASGLGWWGEYIPFIFFFHHKWKCIAGFAEKYLEGRAGCWIFVIQLALWSWNEFWDELPIVVSPLTFQRYAAFEP